MKSQATIETLPCGRKLTPSHGAMPPSPEEWMDRLNAHLSSKGLKSSEQRSKIALAVQAWKGHFRVQDIAKTVQEAHAEIGPATVYRAINLFREAGLLKETLVGESGETVFEVSDGDHHDHIVCLDCDRIFEFHDEGIEALQDKVAMGMGFKPERHRHVVYAHCSYAGKKAKS